MTTPFRRPAPSQSYEPFVRDFYFEPGMSLPIQVLSTPDELFPNGYPSVKRHWVKKVDAAGNSKNMPPIRCTAGHEATGGNCLVCFAASEGIIDADRGRGPSEDVLIPLYDHTQYVKVENKFRPHNPAMPIMDPKVKANMIVGGLKVLYANGKLYEDLGIENQNMRNICSSCGGQMVIECLECFSCQSPIFEANQLSRMNAEGISNVMQSSHTCELCGTEGLLNDVRKCTKCGGNSPRGISDTVLLASRETTYDKNGKKKNHDRFSLAPHIPVISIEPAELEQFWKRLKQVVDSVPSIAQQAERIKVTPPEQWTTSTKHRPYGQQ